MSTAKEFKAKAAGAFQAGNWMDAVEYYNQAVALDPNDAWAFANRSAACLKAGHSDKALADAQQCRKLDPTNSMGYLREAAVLYSQQRYAETMTPLQEGLQACGNNAEEEDTTTTTTTHQDSLQRALWGAQRALLLQQQHPPAKAALKMAAALQAAHFRQEQSLTEATSIMTRNQQERKVGRLVQVALQNKQELITLLDSLPHSHSNDDHAAAIDRQISDLLFFFLLDPPGRGHVLVKDLQALLCETQPGALYKNNLDKEQAILADKLVAAKDGKLDAPGLAKTLQQLAAGMNTTVRGMAEFIIHQTATAVIASTPSSSSLWIPPSTTASSKKEIRITSLFSIFDHDGNDTISFFDLACGIYAWARDHFLDHPNLLSSTKLLLLMDPKDTRRLTYEQFGKFLLTLSSTWNEALEDVLDDLVLAFASSSSSSKDIPNAVLEEIFVGTNNSGAAGNHKLDSVTYARTKQLFQLWDTNRDGSIDFAELLTGLRRYQQASQTSLDGSAATANTQAEKIAVRIMGHDDDNNQTLDPEEFALAMMEYAQAAETDLHQLIDFMCVVVQKAEEDDAYERAYSEATVTAASYQKAGKAFRHNSILMTISDIEEEEDSEEEEEEDE